MVNLWVLLLIGGLVLFLWGFIEFNKIRHKIYAIVIIGSLLFFIISGSFVLKGKNLDYTSVDGVFQAGKIYFSFLGVTFKNLFSLTSNAVKLDWNPDSTPQNSSSK